MEKKSTKEVSVNKTDKYVPIVTPATIKLGSGEDEFEVVIKQKLSLEESMSFVNSVVLGMIDDDIVTYSIKEYLIRVNTLEYFTNIRLPLDLDKKYALVFDSDIMYRIKDKIDEESYNDLLFSIEKQLAFEIAKMNNQFKSETQNYIEKITSEAEQIIEMFQSFGKVFENITPEQLNTILPNLAKFGNEKDLVKAFIDAKKEDEEDEGVE